MIDRRQAPPELLRAREVAEILSAHVNTVKAIPPAQLPFSRIGSRGDRRYSRADVEKYLAARREG